MSLPEQITIKKVAKISLLTALATSAVVCIFSEEVSRKVELTVLITHLLLILNMLGIWLIWRVIFQKKSVALGLAVIILKYPLLGYLVIQMSRQPWFSSIGVLIGFMSFVVSIVLVALLKKN
jgi:hypothetical protein